MMRSATILLLALLTHTLPAVAETGSATIGAHGSQGGEDTITSIVRNISVFRDFRTAEIYQEAAKQPMVSRLEPARLPGVQRPDWLQSRITVGDRTEEKVERPVSRRTYWRYLVPAGAVLAAGTGTYLLYTVRSR